MAKEKVTEIMESENKEEKEQTQTVDRIIKFNKPFKFEGKEYTEVDLTKIDDLCAEDIKYIDRQFQRQGLSSVFKEMSIPYAMIVATKASSRPIEFFNKLPVCEAMKIKNLVAEVFFQGE